MFLIKSRKNNLYIRNPDEMFQKQCEDWLSSLFQLPVIIINRKVIKLEKSLPGFNKIELEKNGNLSRFHINKILNIDLILE